MIMKHIVNQKINSIISLFGGKTKKEWLKRYLFSDMQYVIVNKEFNFKQVR